MYLHPLRADPSRSVGALMHAPLLGLLLVAGDVAATDLSLRQAVDDATLMPNAAVEFTITVENLGPGTAVSVRVADALPVGLSMPAGTVAVASVGDYDVATGEWRVGDLDEGASARLRLPAVVVADPLPPCIVNRSDATAATTDPEPANNTAAASLRLPDVERCVDLAVELLRQVDFYPCDTDDVQLFVRLENRGTDAARDVVVTLEATPDEPPGLAFRGASCDGSRRCTVPNLGAGRITLLELGSRSGIRNNEPREFSAAVSVASPDPDFETGQESASLRFTKAPFGNCPEFVDKDELFGAGGGGMCFVATAAFGSSMHPRVVLLRRFRDRVLWRDARGRALVGWYQRASPPLAAFIAERPPLRTLARGLLWPLIWTITYPAAAPVFLGLIGVAWWWLRARRRRNR